MRIAAAVLLLAIASAVQAADFPQRKAGLWEITMGFAGQAQHMVTKLCVDSGTDAALYKNSLEGGMAKMCSKRDITKSGNVTAIDSVCKIGESTVTGHSVITPASDTAYHIDHTSHMDPPMGGHADSRFTQDGKWVGSCPADMKPGDMVMPTGMKMNVLEMSKTGDGQH